MDIYYSILVGLMIGLVLGKWITDKRWRSLAVRGYQVTSGGRLYEVRDVTPMEWFE